MWWCLGLGSLFSVLFTVCGAQKAMKKKLEMKKVAKLLMLSSIEYCDFKVNFLSFQAYFKSRWLSSNRMPNWIEIVVLE